MNYATSRPTQQDVHTPRMSETPKGLEPQLSSLQPELERGLHHSTLLQLHLPTQDPAEAHQQQTELELQHLPQTNLEQQQTDERTKTVWIKYQCPVCVFILGFCSCAAMLGIAYYLHHFLQNQNQAVVVTPCSSPACQSASAHLSTSADPFTHPCDYFLFSCGPDRLLPDSGGRHRGQDDVQRSRRGPTREDRNVKERRALDRKTELLQNIRQILESNDNLTSSAVRKAKSFYRSCLDTRSLDTAGVEPFLTLIQKFGGWPVSGQWNQTDFNATLSVLMRDYATFPFFNLYVGSKDPNDTTSKKTKRYIQIDQPDLLIPIEWNRKTQKSQAKAKTLRPFLASCQRYLALLGAPDSSSMSHVGMFISLSSELAVAAAPLSHRLAKGLLYQSMTIKELQHKAPAVDWLGCLKAAFHPQPLMEDDHVVLHNLPYIVQMSRIIHKWLTKYELSKSDPLHTFMVLNLLHTLMPALDSRFSDMANNLSGTLGHTDMWQPNLHFEKILTMDGGALHQAVPRWKRCVLETERGFNGVLAHLFKENIAGGGEAEEMIHNILSSFKSQVHQLKWTDDKTLQFVMNKVKPVTSTLVTTKEISSEAELDLLFSQVSVSMQSFFSNYLQLLSLWQKRRSTLLNEQNDDADMLSVSPSLLGNELIIPMGMFISPLFHPTYPRAMNYGVMGFLLAKDVLHLLLPDVYSQSESVRAVGECVWSHYLTVTDKQGGGLPLPAAQQQEVWLQYSALQIALEAYKRSLKKLPADTSVSGFSLTRLFFMSFSQVNCNADPYHHLMPLEPSFLISAICAKSRLCPTNLECPKATQRMPSTFNSKNAVTLCT
ncbi:kell blood group glycoprotein [Nerophis lumbriciformis]|uniref:kell blood group glycoprotein n=1 Tax=Nerophis lumbriciformis TaxID=546530 RepID=UPI002ADFF43C|nr:kell blood group glycoprotein-like [Nerophis lumbriciformis]